MAAQSIRIANERDKALKAEETALKAEKTAEERKDEAEQSRNEALLARNDEQKQRKIAEDNLARAEAEQKRAEEEKAKAENAQKAEEKQRLIAERNLEEARNQKAVADKQTTIAKQQKSLADQSAIKANEQKTVAVNEAELNRRQLYISQLNLAEQAWERADADRMNELLQNQIPEPNQKDLRGFEWYHLWRLGHRDLWTSPQSGMTLSPGFSPDGKAFAITRFDTDNSTKPPKPVAKIVLLDTVSGKETNAVDGNMLLGYLPDGKLLIAGEKDQIVLLDLQTKKVSPTKMKIASMQMPTFSSDGKLAASLGRDGNIDLLDVKNGNRLRSLKVDQNINPFSGMFSMYSHPLRFSPDGKVLAYESNDRVRFWNVNNGQELAGLNSNAPEFHTLSFAPDGKTLATKGMDETIKLWDLATRKELAVLKGRDGVFRLGSGLPNIEFSPDGKILASVSGRGVKLWDVGSKNELSTIRAHSDIISSISFSPDGTKLATVSPNESVRMWNMPHDDAITLSGQVAGGALSPDGKILATVDVFGRFRLWDFATNRELSAFGDPPTDSLRMAFLPKFSPDGKTVAVMRMSLPSRESNTGGDAMSFVLSAALSGYQIEFWDITAKQKLVTLEERSLNSFAFSPDGKVYVTVNHERVRVWNAATHRMIFLFDKAGTIAAFSPDGKFLAIGSGETVRFINISDGKESISPLRAVSAIYAMTFSPDSNILATSIGKEVVLCDFVNRKEIGTLKGHSNMVAYIAFSPDGRRAATVSQDGIVKIWDVDSRQALIAFEMGIALPVAFSPDGKALITYSSRGVDIWRGATDEEVQKQRGH